MNIGAMRHRVWLQYNNWTTQNSEGAPVDNWITVSFLYASIDPMTGRELEIASQMESVASHRIVIRWAQLYGYKDLTKMRFISNNGQIFNIESVNDHEYRNKYIICYCQYSTNRNKQIALVDESYQTLFDVSSNSPILGNA